MENQLENVAASLAATDASVDACDDDEEAAIDDAHERELSPEERGTRRRKWFARQIRKRLRNQKDAIIVITGERGSGKSMLSLQLGKDINPNFKIDEHVLFDPKLEQLHELVFKEKPQSVFVVDEAIRLAHSRQAMTARNIQIVEMVALIRYKTNCIIWNIPLFSSLDSALRNMTTFWVHVVARGRAVIFKGDPDPFSFDPYHFRQSSEILHNALGNNMALANMNELMNALREVPSYIGWLAFDDLPEADKTVYVASKKPYELHKTLEEKREQRKEDRRLSTSSDYEPGKRKSKRDYVV